MATERLPMSKTREILRLRWSLGRSVRETARAVDASVGVVAKTVNRAERAELTWELVEAIEDVELERRLYGDESVKGKQTGRPQPDPVYMHAELRRPGVTLELLHLEYLREHPDGYRYTAYAEVYRRWLKQRSPLMRQHHKAGEKTFVDYSGVRPRVFDPTSGERVDVELFVGVLGASNLTYAEATLTQRVHDFVSAHVRMLEYFGGATEVLVPDQLRSAVSVPSRYEPTVQRTYAEFGRHYGIAVVPARPRKPRDKAKVEVAVQVAQRWILGRLRNETFFSVHTLNVRIRELLDELNDRPMKSFGLSRRALFERIERAALRPLPAERYEVAEWRRARVAPDYHIALFKHWYSAPFQLVSEEVEVRVSATTVEIFSRGQRVAAHRRDDTPYRHTTDRAHMPEAHQRMRDGTDALLSWAASVGPMTNAMVDRLIHSNPVREQGWKSARGIMRVAQKHGAERTERACAHALVLGGRSYRLVASILEHHRENEPLPGEAVVEQVITHENVRGPDYYH
jgi:transposase